MKSRQSDADQIFAILQAGEKLTNFKKHNGHDSIADRVGCLNGKGRISDLRKLGWPIITEKVKVPKRGNRFTEVALYSLPPNAKPSTISQNPLGRDLSKTQPVPLRDLQGRFKTANQSMNQNIREKVREKYVKERKSIWQIKDETGLSYRQVREVLQETGVEFRHRGQQGKQLELVGSMNG